jgi:hypothetical protein
MSLQNPFLEGPDFCASVELFEERSCSVYVSRFMRVAPAVTS